MPPATPTYWPGSPLTRRRRSTFPASNALWSSRWPPPWWCRRQPGILTEGNYLLLDEGHWAAVRASLDEVWWVDGDEALRLERLHARHVRFGRTPAQATAWIASTDEPNARRIEATRSRADFVFRWD